MSSDAPLSTRIRDIRATLKVPPSVFIGFDGFTDEIIQVVASRESESAFVPMSKIAQFKERVNLAEGKSTNFELVCQREKIGGNGPILCEALCQAGFAPSMAGTIGLPDAIEPLFQDLASRCNRVYPLGPSGHTDALEFEDGKLILGKLGHVSQVSYPQVLECVGKERLIQELEEAALFASCNWTMLPHMTELWRGLRRDVLPHLNSRNPRRLLFVDFADPAKRSNGQLQAGLDALKEWTDSFRVVVGLNLAEATRFLSLTSGATAVENTSSSCLEAARVLKAKLGFHQIVIHTVHFAVTSGDEGEAAVNGPFTPNPVLTTGAGDVFNAGFCQGLLLGLGMQDSLLLGVGSSGYYVRTGQSPTQEQLCDFLPSFLTT